MSYNGNSAQGKLELLMITNVNTESALLMDKPAKHVTKGKPF